MEMLLPDLNWKTYWIFYQSRAYKIASDYVGNVRIYSIDLTGHHYEIG